MPFHTKKLFLKNFFPLCGMLLFSVFSVSPVFAENVIPKPAEEQKPFTCSCTFVVKGLDPSGSPCQRSMTRVIVNQGYAISADIAEVLFQQDFGIKAMNDRCYPAPEGTTMAQNARREKAAVTEGQGPVSPSYTLTPETCGKVSGTGSFVDFGAQGHAGLYGVILESCSAADIKPAGDSTKDTSSINSFSAQVQDLNKLKADSLQGVISLFIKTATGIMGTIALVIMIYGGFLWMTSAGNSSQIEKAQDVLIWGALGIFLIFSSYALITFIFQAVNPTLTK